MRIGITATQVGLNEKQLLALTKLLTMYVAKPTGSVFGHFFYHGDCVGGDAQAHKIAKQLGYKIQIHPPIDESKRAFCKGAWKVMPAKDYLELLIVGPRTNQEELRSGTWSTKRYAEKIGRKVKILLPE